jgi:hypothetical protein
MIGAFTRSRGFVPDSAYSRSNPDRANVRHVPNAPIFPRVAEGSDRNEDRDGFRARRIVPERGTRAIIVGMVRSSVSARRFDAQPGSHSEPLHLPRRALRD